MASFEKFNFKSLADLEGKIAELNLDISLSHDLDPLSRRIRIGRYELPNSLAIQPMEGCDGTAEGSPSELTLRRYRRFARSGAGLLWFEATSVVPEGRANPRQLFIQSTNLASFQEMVAMTLREARESMGGDHRPLTILQLTHSGRYSKPEGKPLPVIAQHDSWLDPGVGISRAEPPMTDTELEALQEKYVEAAQLAQKAGFDGVDIKACHRYLISELLASHTRGGKYGGDFANRTRFLLETVARVREQTGPGFILAVRLNVFDGHPYPYGWGVDPRDHRRPDLSEPAKLAGLLRRQGVSLLGVTAGNPYYKNPEINRPFDAPVIGAELPEEHPLESVARLFSLAREIQQAEPALSVAGCGYSWLRQFFGYAAAANIAKGAVTLVGLGRLALAYPDSVKDLITHGRLDEHNMCITCSRCTQIMRDGGRTGCVVRDPKVYLPIYKNGR